MKSLSWTACFFFVTCSFPFRTVAQTPQVTSHLRPEVTQQLPPGKTPGTFAFSYTGTVVFSQEPAFPVNVVLMDYAHKPIAQIPVHDSSPFTLSIDLAPGGYWIQSLVAPAQDKTYWGSQLEDLFIDKMGLATNNHFFNDTLRHQKKMTVLSPDPKGGSTLTEKRPLLQWQALPGAVRYKVYWLVEDGPHHVLSGGNGTTTETQFRLTEDTIPDRQYEWNVNAFGNDGEELGYWSAAYFFTPGGKESFAKALPFQTKGSKGTPYIGISPMKFSGGDMSKGIFVQSVGAGSPALEAGLQPHDLLTRFDGRSLETITETEFVNLVRAKAVGTVVPIEFLRDGVKKTATLTVEAMP